MFQQHVLQADQGCDFDFLRRVDEPEHDMAAHYALIGHS
jgi:hypothetical protein